jgi:hypothetical protein
MINVSSDNNKTFDTLFLEAAARDMLRVIREMQDSDIPPFKSGLFLKVLNDAEATLSYLLYVSSLTSGAPYGLEKQKSDSEDSERLYLIELRARGLYEDLKGELERTEPTERRERYLALSDYADDTILFISRVDFLEEAKL